jgi:hypothetical protein
VSKANKEEVRVVKSAPRKFRITGEYNEDGEELQELVAPAEYAVLKGDSKLASVVKTGDG